MKIPFFDIKKQNLLIKEELSEAINRVIHENSNFILGKELNEFEKSFADYCDKKYCIGLGNGTDALKIALRSLDINPNDEIIAPVNTAIPTITSIIEIGAKPVLVDIKNDYLIDTDLI